jgi:folate-binding protein YgfZ
MTSCVLLADRGVLEIAGPDRRSFLQGLVSNDVTRVTPERAVYAALLTAQGKYLHDFFIVEQGDALLLDGEAARLADLGRRLGLYKLRARVAIADASERYAVAAVFGVDDAAALARTLGDAAYVDPRLPALGLRLMLPRAAGLAALEAKGIAAADPAAYDRLRLALGIPDGSRDLVVEKTILLEAGFDELNGVDWQKGCYIGQELTARTKYRGLVKRRLLPVTVEGPLPPPGTPVLRGEEEAGEMRSGREDRGLALIRLEMLETGPLSAAGARIMPHKPDWLRF